MASEPTTPVHPGAAERPVIDNQVAAYHAVSAAAIASLVFGIGAILSFVSIYFTFLGALAIAFGVIAQRNIRRLPDALTGTKMANAGTALGLLFSLSSLTIIGVQYGIIDYEAKRFAREYVAALRKGSLDEVLYWENHPDLRKGKSVEEMAKQYRESAREGRDMFQMQTQPVRDLLARLASTPGQTVELGPQLGHGFLGMEAYVQYLLILKGPKSAPFPEETQYASLGLQGVPMGRTYGWKVLNLKFPAEPPAGTR